MKTKMTIALAATIGALALAANAQDNTPSAGGPPPADAPSNQQHAGGPAGRGERGGFHLLPPRATEALKLTDDQKTQVAALEAETKAKLEKILTPEQMTQLKNMRPPMRPVGGHQRGGPGGGDDGRPSGPPPSDN